jgi:hypothetical protein
VPANPGIASAVNGRTADGDRFFLYSAIGAIQSKSNDFVSLRASSDVLNLWIRMVGGSAAVMHLFGGRSG